MSRSGKLAVALSATTAGVGAVYLGLVTGAVPINLGIGRTTRPLGPLSVEIAAPRDTVFDVISAPYDVRAPRGPQPPGPNLQPGARSHRAARGA